MMEIMVKRRVHKMARDKSVIKSARRFEIEGRRMNRMWYCLSHREILNYIISSFGRATLVV
jgi:uncharacterized protein YkuJ